SASKLEGELRRNLQLPWVEHSSWCTEEGARRRSDREIGVRRRIRQTGYLPTLNSERGGIVVVLRRRPIERRCATAKIWCTAPIDGSYLVDILAIEHVECIECQQKLLAFPKFEGA